MAVTSKELRTVRSPSRSATMARGALPISYIITGLLAVIAIYVLVGALVGWAQVRLDDLRYGWPRTTQMDAVVGHESNGQPTHFMAMNLNRQVLVLEIVGGDPNTVRSLPGPYLFGAGEDLTPVTMAIQDVDNDGLPDLLLDVRRERIVYLNRDGAFRLPTTDEQRQLATP